MTLARNGREALDVLENSEESEHIDLVLTDILMPEVSYEKKSCEDWLPVCAWSLCLAVSFLGQLPPP